MATSKCCAAEESSKGRRVEVTDRQSSESKSLDGGRGRDKGYEYFFFQFPGVMTWDEARMGGGHVHGGKNSFSIL